MILKRIRQQASCWRWAISSILLVGAPSHNYPVCAIPLVLAQSLSLLICIANTLLVAFFLLGRPQALMQRNAPAGMFQTTFPSNYRHPDYRYHLYAHIYFHIVCRMEPCWRCQKNSISTGFEPADMVSQMVSLYARFLPPLSNLDPKLPLWRRGKPLL